MNAFLNTDEKIKVEIKNDSWYFESSAYNYWIISDWVEATQSREFTSNTTGNIDASISFGDNTNIEIILYENDETSPAWTKKMNIY